MTMPNDMALEQRRAKRRSDLAGWTRCAWCWNQLPADPVKKAGRPYCDERCAGHDATVAIDAGPEDAHVDVSDHQMSFDA